jgi:hypothetical protein
MIEVLGAMLRRLQPGWWLVIGAQCFLGSILWSETSFSQLTTANIHSIFLGALVWMLGMGGAAFAITSAFPSPENEMSHAPLPFPPAIFGWAGLALMLGGLLAAPAISWWFFDVYLASIALLVIYATPPARLARWIVPDIIIQVLGIGLLSLYAGHAILLQEKHNIPHTSGALLYLAATACLVCGARVCLSRKATPMMPLLYAFCLIDGFVCAFMGLGQLGHPTSWLWIAAVAWIAAGLVRYLIWREGTAPRTILIAAALITQMVVAGIVLRDIL